MVAYDGFYDRLKVINKGQYSVADIGFYLVDMEGKTCELTSGKIYTQSKELPLNFTKDAKLLLPFDETLDKDKAVIVAQQKDDEQSCQLKLQIESSSSYSNSLTRHQAYVAYSEFDDLIGGLSGFFMRTLFAFMMPDVNGINVTFSSDASISGSNQHIQCKQNKCTIFPQESWLQDQTPIRFNQKIDKVIPFIEK